MGLPLKYPISPKFNFLIIYSALCLRPCKMKKLFLFYKILSPKKTKKQKEPMKTKNISVESINKDFSSFGGIKIFDLMYNLLKIRNSTSELLPKKKLNSGITQDDKFKTLLFSFLCGADCIDDLSWLRMDTAFKSVTSGAIAPTTAGDFLRSFNQRSIEQIEEVLIELALKQRLILKPDDKSFELSIDSTPHIQTGLKMEGLQYDYKNNWGLNSQNAYDQYGFSYGFQLRPGATYSGNGAGAMIRNILNKVPKNMNKKVRGDSAYCNLEVMNTCINQNAKFALAMKANVYNPILEKNRNTMKWKKTKIKFFDSDECELGEAIYSRSDLAGGLTSLRVVFIRAPKTDGSYHHYAICTNMRQHQWKAKQVIKFYRGRANCENFIKEQKYGMDFKHFPCKKLNANRVYGLIGTIAYNMMRMASFLIDEERGCFIQKNKKITFRNTMSAR